MAYKYSIDPMVARSIDRAHLTKAHLELSERSKQMPYQTCINVNVANQSAPNYKLPTIDLDKNRMIDIQAIVQQFVGPDQVYEGKYLLCRSILPPNRTSALQLVVDDPCGERCVRVSLYNFDRSIRPGTVLAIMHPWFKRTLDGSTAIRVENPNHVHLFGENDELLKDIDWKAPLPKESGVVDKTAEKSSSASTSVSSKKPNQPASTRNQKQASSSTKKGDQQSADVKRADEIAGSKEHEAMIAKEAKGEYDLFAMIEESKTTKHLDMHDDYYASEFYDRIAGKRRGYVAAKKIPAGLLLMACQAYEMPKSGNIDDILNRPIVSKGDLRRHNKLISTFDEFCKLLADRADGLDSDDEVDVLMRSFAITFSFMPRIDDVLGLGGYFNDDANIWIRPAYLNHTCYQANCFRFRIGDFQFVRTKREIKRGEELLVEYVSPRKSYEERNQLLESQYGFRCNCDLCRLESSVSASVRRLMTEIAAILDEMRQRHASNGGMKQNDVDTLRKLLPDVRKFLPPKNEKENHLAHRVQKALAIGIINNPKNYPTIEWKMKANVLMQDLFEMAIKSNDVYMAFLHAKLLINMADERMKMYEKEKQSKMVSDEEANVEKWTTEARKLARILFGDESMADQIRVGVSDHQSKSIDFEMPSGSAETSSSSISPPKVSTPPILPTPGSFSALSDAEFRKNSCPTSSSSSMVNSSASSSAISTLNTMANNKVIVGICAMAKKASGKPMKFILGRLHEYYSDYMEVLVFAENAILVDPVESWPIVHVLIGFHSIGFPMEKMQSYVRLRDPYVLNDLEKQLELLDRTKVYKALEALRIDLPRYTVMRRDGDRCVSTLVEHDDHIEVNGEVFNKPFVEKPISAEDHNIFIYYPSSAGGGSQRLFRKVNNRSSIYSSESRVRQTGSYIYEEFMPTDGTDVKVYAVGPDYAHAEARKSPALDGKVERDSEGKEIRYPVILTNREKTFARKIVWMFRQTVCGFDLLRANGKSYVCDVNGFSFVKTSTKYYDDTARILGNMIVRKFAPRLRIPWVPPSLDDPPLVSTTSGTVMELRCVLGVIRHGDRTPKQKLKMEVYHSRWFDLFNKYASPSKNADASVQELKLKKPNQLQEVLDIARDLLTEMDRQQKLATSDGGGGGGQVTVAESKCNLEQVKTVLEMYGHFSGINRKVQFKYLREGRFKASSETETDSGSTREEATLLLILKWGGELTPAGVMQAEELGKAFRCLYPGGQGQYGGDSRGLGFLRLHSTYRHDLKIYASEEGRVQMTAAAFTKGLLALEGELAPILVQMVKSANTDGLLDDDKEARRYQTKVKKYLHQYLQVDRVLEKEDMAKLNPLDLKSIQNALQFIENPRRKCERIWNLTSKLYDIIRMRRRDARLKDQTLYLTETWDLAERRWVKLVKDFRRVKKDGEVHYDISKIPDIYDCIKYDLEHNVKFFNTDDMEELYICSKYMADVVVPQEYGIQRQEKMLIGQGTCTPLMKKLVRDLKICLQPEEEGTDDGISTRLDPRASEGIQTPARHVRTRLYFTSESHIHSLMNVIRYGGLVQDVGDKQWQRAMSFLSSVTELNYMAQLVIMLYEDTTKELTADDRFHVELHFSPGALPCIQTTHVPGLGYRPKSRESDLTTPTPSGCTSVAQLSRLASVDESKVLEESKLKLTESQSAATITSVSDDALESDAGSSDGNPKKTLSAPVNIVAVGDRISRPITNEELARYSPSSSPRALSPVAGNAQSLPDNSSSKPIMMKSLSDVSCNAALNAAPPVVFTTDGGEEQEQSNYNSNVVAVTEQTTNTRRNRLFYAGVRHHTTNLLRHRDSMNLKQLISTAVINGLFSGNNREERMIDPALVNTAVIARGSSEPDLLTFSKLSQATQQDVSDISFYVPPLRSLETLHNQLSLRQVSEFLERITTTKTPAASPPKTPRASSMLSREDSLMSGSASSTQIDPAGGLQLSAAAISERLGKLKRERKEPTPSENS